MTQKRVDLPADLGAKVPIQLALYMSAIERLTSRISQLQSSPTTDGSDASS
jgi:hypothetical protein